MFSILSRERFCLMLKLKIYIILKMNVGTPLLKSNLNVLLSNDHSFLIHYYLSQEYQSYIYP